MDGLTVSTSQALLERGQTLKEIRDSEFNKEIPNPGSEPGGKSFADTLKDAVQSVNQMQQTSDQKMEAIATGRSRNIADTMIAAEKADIAFKLMVQVRNKIIEAYQEIMKMQV